MANSAIRNKVLASRQGQQGFYANNLTPQHLAGKGVGSGADGPVWDSTAAPFWQNFNSLNQIVIKQFELALILVQL